MIQDTSPRQVIYVYKCENSTLQIKGKVNAITLGEEVVWISGKYSLIVVHFLTSRAPSY